MPIKVMKSPASTIRSGIKIAVPLNWYRKYPKIYKEDEPYVKGYYRKTIDLAAAELRHKAVLLRFGTVGYEATLWVNGEKAGSHHGDFVPWEIDITRFLKPGKNLLALQVFSDFGPARSKIRLGARTYGSQWSVSNIKGGIWQDVDLVFTTPVRIERLLVTPHLAGDTVELDYRIENPADRPIDVEIGAAVSTALKTGPNKLNAAAAPETLRLRPGRNAGQHLRQAEGPGQMGARQPVPLLCDPLSAAGRQTAHGPFGAVRLPRLHDPERQIPSERQAHLPFR